MSRDYLDLVVVDTQFGKRLFRAPAWSYFKPGDRVKVDTRAGAVVGTVLDSKTEVVNDLDFYFSCTDATKPLKRVIAKIIESELNYDAYDDCENENEEDEA